MDNIMLTKTGKNIFKAWYHTIHVLYMRSLSSSSSCFRKDVPHRLRVHSRSRPQTDAAPDPPQQGNGGRDGRHRQQFVFRVQETLLYRLFAFTKVTFSGISTCTCISLYLTLLFQVFQLVLESLLSHARRKRSGHCHRARQNRQESSSGSRSTDWIGLIVFNPGHCVSGPFSLRAEWRGGGEVHGTTHRCFHQRNDASHYGAHAPVHTSTLILFLPISFYTVWYLGFFFFCSISSNSERGLAQKSRLSHWHWC